jgi:putative Holliday junction resolvase
MKILGLDYGTVRVGVAVSYASLAQPLTILPNNSKLVEAIMALVAEHRIARIVVGESEGAMAKRSKEFADLLEQRLGLPIILIDETLSSYQVHEYLRGRRLKKRGRIDHLAAAVILQNYLDDLTAR